MKKWQFYSLQSSLMVVGSLAAEEVVVSIIFLIMAVVYLVSQIAAHPE